MITVALLCFAALVACCAMRWMPSARWTSRAPRLGIAAWYAVLVTITVASVAAVREAVIPIPGAAPAWCNEVIWCEEAMRGPHETSDGIVSGVLATIGAVVVLVAAVRMFYGALVVARNRRRHRTVVRLAGRVRADLEATVIDHLQPAAYVVPGRSYAVVVTSGALQQLSAAQLAAVIAHEQAHAAGRHQLLLDVMRVAAAAVPRCRVFATARDQVERLIEIRADDVAAERHRRGDLAHALVTMATPHSGGPSPVAVGLAAATGGDAAERLHRLMRPPRGLHRVVQVTSWAAVAVLPAAPMALASTCQWWPPLGACLWVA